VEFDEKIDDQIYDPPCHVARMIVIRAKGREFRMDAKPADDFER